MTFDLTRLGNSGQTIAAARAEGRSALVAYLPVGFPDLQTSIDAMVAVSEGSDGRGADFVEIGMPYSDPVMDGSAIQYATNKALQAGTRTRDLFTAVEQLATRGNAPTLMIYWNLVERYGVTRFARDLASAGGAGLITPDLTPDEADEWISAAEENGLDRVFLVAPNSTDERLKMTVSACRGWVYATSVLGVTGARQQTSKAAPMIVQRTKHADPTIPVGVGLGVSNGQQAAEVASYADAVIVGSALVMQLIDIEQGRQAGLDGLRRLASELAAGVRGGE